VQAIVVGCDVDDLGMADDGADGRLLERIVKFLTYDSNMVVSLALQVIANISCSNSLTVFGSDLPLERLIEDGVLPILLRLLGREAPAEGHSHTFDDRTHQAEHFDSVRLGAARAIANISAGKKPQLRALVETNVVSARVPKGGSSCC